MCARSNSLTKHLTGAPAETVREIVQRAEGKLSALQESRAHLRKRIQALNHLSRALADNIVVPAAVTPQPKFASSDGNPSAAEPARPLSSLLRRACRIALMEIEDPECSEQIFERIRKRKSVSLEQIPDPLHAIMRELKQMANEREATCYREGNIDRWQLRRG